ncbi:MAG: methyltransferase [Terriglobia bacterium]|jgi:protein-S-isoprenylcysteine O-methyltransferase Ste14
MSLKHLSVIAFLGAGVCLVWLAFQKVLLGAGPVTIAIQVLAVLLMIWARLTFGLRSFHAAANPTSGGLVTRGPYRWLRHPIYSAILYFVWAGIAAHPSGSSILVALLASALLGVRMVGEERLLREMYPEYAEYARDTARVLPYIF